MFWCLSFVFMTFGCVISTASKDSEIVEDLLNIILKLKGTSEFETRSIPAFTVTLSQDFTPAANSFIKFDKVKINIGHHYSPDTGIFTAPKSGLYTFSATIRSNDHKHLHCDLMVNDIPYGKVYGINYSTGTINAVVQLKKGDKVSIRKDNTYGSDESMIGRDWSIFSGYLIA